VIGGVYPHAVAALATAVGGQSVLSMSSTHHRRPKRVGINVNGVGTALTRSQSHCSSNTTVKFTIASSAPARRSRCVTVQRKRLVGGWPRTVRLLGGLVIPAGATMTLEPGGSHLALFGLRADLVQGETFPLTIDFNRTGEVKIIARVRRKGDAAGTTPLPPVSVVDFTVARPSAQLAPQATPVAWPHRRQNLARYSHIDEAQLHGQSGMILQLSNRHYGQS
jgi:hypothetical protein